MKLLNSYLNKYGFFLFAIITFAIAITRVPFWDEAHGYDISCLSLGEIFHLTRIEGHFLIWFLILKPFSFIELYPYPMLILNWAFMALAVFILWKKAPFSPLAKFLICFSTPCLLYFAPVARCYSVGILFLFLICTFYPKRLEKPRLFAFLILICANTSVLALVGSFYIALAFLFDLIKGYLKKRISNRKLIETVLIFLLCALLILAQTYNLRHSGIRGSFVFSDSFLAHIFKIDLFFLLTVFPVLVFKHSKRAFYFAFCVYFTLSYIFFFVHFGSYWNHYFYYIYFIVLFWLFKKQLFKNKILKILFYSTLILLTFPNTLHKDSKLLHIYSSKANKIAEYIASKDYLKNAKLYSLQWWSDITPSAGVYLAKNNIKIYDVENNDKRSFKSIEKMSYWANSYTDIDSFYNLVDKNKDNYVLTANLLGSLKFKNTNILMIDNNYIFYTPKGEYLFELKDDKKKDLGLLIYKISKI